MVKWLGGFIQDYGVWATFLSALVGFGGVVLTLVIQHKGDLHRDRTRLRDHQKGVAAAFLAELRAIRDYASVSVENLDDPSQPTFLMPKHLPFVVFDALKGSIDALEPNQIEKVVACYVWLPEISRRLSMLAGGQVTPDGLNIPMKAEHANIFKFLMEELGKLATGAIAALSASDAVNGKRT